MNNPFASVLGEIRSIADDGFEFVDLTLEPPGAWPVDPVALRDVLSETGLGVVGHTAFFLPIASPYPELRAAARELFARSCDAFHELGADRVNVHPDTVTRTYPRAEVIAGNADAMRELAEVAAARELRLMLENLGQFGSVEDLARVLDADDRVGFHLDVGHAHLGGERLPALLEAFGDRLAHVHVHDNFGSDDLHLPLGAGRISWPDVVDAVRGTGYDGTVTIEVFARPYRAASARLWREWWNAA